MEGSDDPDTDLSDRDVVLPQVAKGEMLSCEDLELKGHTTQPPNRFSEATLTRALEEMGIGRPSTYASIIDTILAREYVFKSKRGNMLVPTWTAFAVANLLESHLPDLVDYKFTAEMEDSLDAISRGEADPIEYLKKFYLGNSHPGLKQLLSNKVSEIDARDVCRIFIGKPEGEGETAQDIFVRVGRYGPFLEQGERRASLPDKLAPDELSIESALAMLEKSSQAEEPLGICPDTHKPVFVKVGRFGPYVQRGTAEDDDKPQNASLLKGMEPQDVDLVTALKLLSLPRTVGNHPESGLPIEAQNGRYGPYVKCGEETRSLGDELSPLDVTLEQALALLAQPKAGGLELKAPKEPIKVFEASPVTSQPVRVLEGRFGPYVTDGVTNASLPKDAPPAEVTFEYALNLLQARAEAGRARGSLSAKKRLPNPPLRARPKRRKNRLRKRRRKRMRERGNKDWGLGIRD